ncbi:ubiquinol-cytochrome C chaperone-domain-containing protein [Gilbertella persicaria]|uniref:ubiquinol-cytochrome C chaperone-domain-containing protein n=1 Tax=Gilbertella persicaria TaxID=101096 RepID=UPI0022200966|nr:ubiquinol-cytochrome C chaperone-domain-containing protein [Gilbertella persicaria]KAI8081878.1 ubiquinol-cytochrome C chaperone-domain-containing protein [Gilbertella persicaria]
MTVFHTRFNSTVSQPKYSATTKKLVYGLAKVLGYYSTGSTAIKASHNLYKTCAQQMELNKGFYIQECNLPDNFQSWFAVTQLHVWMVMVHLRAEGQGKLYIQELVNRFFEDAEARIREHGITQQKVINTYIKDLLAQFHGGVVAYDEGMCKDDPVLAAALWRNLFAISSNNATHLALVVQYIRRELQALEKYGGQDLNAGKISFQKPLDCI